MFIRVNTTANSPRRSVQIVESKRMGSKVKTKIIRHVGIAHDDFELAKLRALACDIIAKISLVAQQSSRQLTLFPQTQNEISMNLQQQLAAKRGRPPIRQLQDMVPPNQVTLDSILEQKRVTEGVGEVCSVIYGELGFEKILNSRQDKLLKDLVFARIGAPCSKRKLSTLLELKFDKDYELDRIYRMMDKLVPKIELVKLRVFEATKTLLPEPINLMLFDVTTLYFESEDTDDLRAFGYSKDCKFNNTQLVLALATNTDGLPIGYELFKGNTAEVSTLLFSLEKWKQNLSIKDVCFVGDRAMFSEANLDLMDKHGYKYVVAAKMRNMKSVITKEILNEANYKSAEFGSEVGLIAEFKYQNRRLISGYKHSRSMRDAKIRQRILDKIEKSLSKDKKTLQLPSNRGVRKYTTSLARSQVILDQAKVDADKAWDGIHGVITNITDQSPLEVLKCYSRLWAIEESFRINKYNLKMRPIYHWKQRRIESHIAICYMSFAILRHLQYRVKLTQKLSVESIMEELMNVQASIYVHESTGHQYRVPGSMSHKASKIYRALGLRRSLHAEAYVQ
jgi:transposase